MSWFSFGLESPERAWVLLALLPVLGFAWWSRRALSRGRARASVLARLLMVLLLSLALMRLSWLQRADALAVVFVLDRSASVDAAAQAQAQRFVQEALGLARDRDQAGVVVFGADAMVERELADHPSLDAVDSTPNRGQSDLSAGLRLASALLPADRAGRIVLLSDGVETRGAAATEVGLLKASGVEVAVVPLGAQRGPDVWLEDLILPPTVDAGAAFDVRVAARSEAATSGTVRLYRDDRLVAELPVQLSAGGLEAISVRQEAGEGGLLRFRAQFEPDNTALDARVENDVAQGAVRVAGLPRVLLVEREPGAYRSLAQIWEREGLQVDAVDPASMPAGLSALGAYDLIVLGDVPSYAIPGRQQEAMRSAVRDLGKGLLMIGGDQSFGLGGWYRSPVEEALPVRMDLEDKSRFPALGMVLALDKSCSMGGGQGSPLELAKEASIQTVELLSPRDQVGLIGFDGSASWIVRLGPLDDRDGVIQQIGAIRGGGGTDVYPALKTGIEALAASEAALRHVVVLSDGITAPADFKGLMQRANADQVSVTSVMIGPSADVGSMSDWAKWGGGRAYHVTDAQSIPAIFTREAMLASRSFLIEEPFTPVSGATSSLTRGVGPIPKLGGLVATEARARATVALLAPDKDPSKPALPLLAHIHYGLGRSVAFTSDARPRWDGAWMRTESFDQLWSQTGRWLVQGAGSESLQLYAEVQGGMLQITADAYDPQGGFLNFLQGEARVVAPDLSVRAVTLRQVGPGRYAGSTPLDQDGAWVVGAALLEGEQVVAQGTTGAVQAYSPEFRATRDGMPLLSELGRLGGGGTLSTAAEAMRPPVAARPVPRPLWWWLLLAAAVLWFVDLAIRRLQVGRAGQAEAINTLLPRAGAVAGPRVVPSGGPSRAAVVSSPTQARPAAAEMSPESYAGRLLAARKKARDKLDQDGGDR